MLRRFRLSCLLCLLGSLLPLSTGAESADFGPDFPIVEQVVPAPGETVSELLTIEVRFDRAVDGVEARDLLVNGSAATAVEEVAEGQFVFTFAPLAPGSVTVEWQSDHAITDGMDRAFTGGLWNYTLDPRFVPRVIISELMASNKRTLRDGDGDSSDWIELFNASEEEVSIEGWSLTDAESNLHLWEFPAVSIPAKGFLSVFASGKDRRDPERELHTNFKLGDKGQYLALVLPDGTVASAFAPSYPPQSTDVSYGRAQGSPESLGYFSKPTPGQANSTTGAGFASEVQYSSVTGAYKTEFLLTLQAATNAIVRYTLNGALPTNSSPIYVQPIPITNSTVVRARAFQNGLLPGLVRTENFTFYSNLESFTSTLPVLVIQTLGRAPSATVNTTSEFSIFMPRNGVTTLTNDPTLTVRGGMHIRGSSSRGFPKSSYALEVWDEFNNSQDVSLLGMPAESDWVLYAPNGFDPIMIHNPFIFQLSREIGQYSPRTRFVELFVQTKSGAVVSNHYNGVYVLMEKIKIGQDRVSIDKLRAQNVVQPSVTGGYLLKVDRTGPGESGIPGAGANVVYVDPKEREVKQTARRPQDTYLRNYFSSFQRALNSANYRDPVAGYRAFIDEQSWIDYHVLEVLSGNVDSLVLSSYFHKPREGKLTFGPHWDFDRALGSTDGRDSNPRNWRTGPFFSAAWWSRLFTDRDFWQLWVDKWQELRLTTFSLDHIAHVIDTLSGELREAQPRETRRWRTPLRGAAGYQGEIDLMKNWLSNRIDFIDRQLTQPPIASVAAGPVPPGAVVELKAQPAATIYYTLDGTDPRLPQGELSPAAFVYSAPLVISQNIHLFARARNLSQRQTGGPPASTPWSGPTVGAYFIDSPRLVVTEINFNPVAPEGTTNSASDYEFIELKNAGSKTVDLGGMVLGGGIHSTFARNGPLATLAPGERLLLVKNDAVFREAHPLITNVAGQFDGSLANEGDRLKMLGALGEPIFDFQFSDEWQRPADGLGFTLTLVDERIEPKALGDRVNWRVSAKPGGSPGVEDVPPAPFPGILITETLSNPKNGLADRVELYNPTTAAVDLSGWFLTDDPHSPFKYQIPASTFIAPRNFLVLADTQFRAGENGFGLSADGDAVYLFAAHASGDLTGYYHGFEFGATEPGRSYGLFDVSDGQQCFVPQAESSLGFPNGYPAVGPIVISEIMFTPGKENSQAEFIELRNVSESPVALSDEMGRGWRLRGGIEFDFPPGVVLPSQDSIVVTSINPANQYFANQFRSRYGLTTQARLFGPWTGTLANEGDFLELQRPFSPDGVDSAGALFAVVDRVRYTPLSPWPNVANASGPLLSISRLGLTLFGDDPGNWTAGLPSPGLDDSDHDGLPDAWEISNHLNAHSAADEKEAFADSDGDGFTNYEEFVAGTSPVDPASFLSLNYAFNGREVVLSFNPDAGRSYTILSADDLKSNAWHPLRNYSLITNSTPITLRDPATRKARYYKLQVP